MAKWILLQEALQIPSVNKLMSERGIAYSPNKEKSLSYSEKFTGITKTQTFTAEVGHVYYPILFNEEVWLVSGDVTEDTLELRGREGYLNGIGILKNIADLYSNSKLQAEGKAWTEDMVKILYNPDIKPVNREYWLAFISMQANPNNRSLCSMNKSRIEQHALHYSFCGCNVNKSFEFAMRPLIHLPSNILVDIQDEMKPLILKLPNARTNLNKKEIMFTKLRSKILKHAELEEILAIVDEIEKMTTWKRIKCQGKEPM